MGIPRRTVLMLAAAAFICGAAGAYAQQVDVVQSLSFGNLMPRNNNAKYAVTVTPQGSASYPFQIISISPANNGIYQLSGFTPNADVFITFSPTVLQLSCGCGAPDFTLDNFAISPATPRTDAAGSATIRLGARLRTSGTSASYAPAAYHGQLTLVVNN